MSLGLVVGEALAGYYGEAKNIRDQESLGKALELAVSRNESKFFSGGELSRDKLEKWGTIKNISRHILGNYHKWAINQDNFDVQHVEKIQEADLVPGISLLAIPDTIVLMDGDTPFVLEHKVRHRYRPGDFGIDYQSVAACMVSGSVGTLYNVLEYSKLKLHREVIIRSEHELSYFKNIFINIGQDILSTPGDKLYPVPFKRCSCEYFELCNGEMQGLDMEDIISSLYQETIKSSEEKTLEESEGGE